MTACTRRVQVQPRQKSQNRKKRGSNTNANFKPRGYLQLTAAEREGNQFFFNDITH